MKLLALVIVVSFCVLCGHLPAAESKRPNIVLIFADDLGWKDTGFTGSDFYETPNLDRLAKEGMVFTDAYAGAGNCQPSRACLLSGQYTPRHGVYAVGDTDRGPKNLMRMVPVPNHHGLAAENVTLAEALKAAGYATGIFGKWHLDGADGAAPAAQGFDTVHESYAGWKDATPDPMNPKGIYSLTRAAGEFMERNKDRPFFVYLPHYAIHTALQARASTLEKFQAKPAGAQHSRALYAACTYDLDDGIGLLLKKLADIGERKNLARENSSKRDELLDDLLKWMASVKAPLPTQRNAAYRPNEAAAAPKGKSKRAQAQGEGAE